MRKENSKNKKKNQIKTTARAQCDILMEVYVSEAHLANSETR